MYKDIIERQLERIVEKRQAKIQTGKEDTPGYIRAVETLVILLPPYLTKEANALLKNRELTCIEHVDEWFKEIKTLLEENRIYIFH